MNNRSEYPAARQHSRQWPLTATAKPSNSSSEEWRPCERQLTLLMIFSSLTAQFFQAGVQSCSG